MTFQKRRKVKSADIYSKQKRSEIMGSVKGKNNLLELKFCKILKYAGFNFSRNVEKLPGKPDIVFRKKKIVIFIDGCFWHGCKVHFKLPQSNQWFWEEKIGKNIKRDKQINKFYKEMGWLTARIWQHDIEKHLEKTMKSLLKILV